MTFRDTSAFTTLDNANMGTREDFEKWYLKDDMTSRLFCRASALAGYQARQPEIDALKEERDHVYSLLRGRTPAQCDLLSLEIASLKAENERLISANLRLQEENERLREELSKLKPHPCLHGILMNGTAMKDFSTHQKEER